jgi:hypothetical protein
MNPAVSKALTRWRELRQHLPNLKTKIQGEFRFGRHYWQSMGVYDDLQEHLTTEAGRLAPCRAGQCQQQQKTDTLIKASYEYFLSVLDLFRAHEPTGLVVSTALAGPFSLNQDNADQQTDNHGKNHGNNPNKDIHSYLYAKEIGHCVAFVNDAITNTLLDMRADFPLQGEDADQLPVIYQTLKQYGYSSILSLSGGGINAHHQRVDYWTHSYRFEVAELHLTSSSANQQDAVNKDTLNENAPTEIAFSYRNSKRHWYCGLCLRHEFERFCKIHSSRHRGKD